MDRKYARRLQAQVILGLAAMPSHNIITPLMVYFPLILVFARRWQKDFGLGSLTAMMIPYSIWMLITGVILVVAWAFLGFDLGPGAPMAYTLPG